MKMSEEAARALVEDFADAIIAYESEVSGGTERGRREAQNQISKTRATLIRALKASAPSPSAGGDLHCSGADSQSKPAGRDEETIALRDAYNTFQAIIHSGGALLRMEDAATAFDYALEISTDALARLGPLLKSTPSLQGEKDSGTLTISAEEPATSTKPGEQGA